jgi:hypothetical protein
VFKIGDRVSIPNRGRGLSAREQGTVVSVDPEKGTVLVQRMTANKRSKMIAGTRYKTGETMRNEHLSEHPIGEVKKLGSAGGPKMTKQTRVKRMQDSGGVKGASDDQLIEDHGELGALADNIYQEHRGWPEPNRTSENEHLFAERDRALARRRRILERQAAVEAELHRRGFTNSDDVVTGEDLGWRKHVQSFVSDESGTARVPPPKMTAEEIRAVRTGKAPMPVDPGKPAGEPAPSNRPAHVEALLGAIREAKPLVGQQKKMYSAQRAARTQAAHQAGKGLKGFEWRAATRPHLKGALEKLDFTPLADALTPEQRQAVVEQVSEYPAWQRPDLHLTKQKSIDAVEKMLEGKLPARHELVLLQKALGPDVVKELMSKRPEWQRLYEHASSLMQASKSSLDFSAPLRQGLVLSAANPKRAAQAFVAQFKYAFSSKSFDQLHEEIVAHPRYEMALTHGVDFTEHGAMLGGKEEAYGFSPLAERLGDAMRDSKVLAPLSPLGDIHSAQIRGSERAFTGFLNKLRMDSFSDMVDRYKKLGLDPEAKGNGHIADEIADWVNDASGRGKLPQFLDRSSGLLSTLMYSPRLQASRLRLMNPIRYMTSSPALRQEAMRAALNFSMAFGTVAGMAILRGAKVDTNPTSPDFGKVRVGNTRYDMLGGFQQYARLAGTFVAWTSRHKNAQGRRVKMGETLSRFARSKASPAVGMAADVLWQKDANGKKITNWPAHVAVEGFAPMAATDMYDAMKDSGVGEGIAKASPGIIGVGVQTYGSTRNRLTEPAK